MSSLQLPSGRASDALPAHHRLLGRRQLQHGAARRAEQRREHPQLHAEIPPVQTAAPQEGLGAAAAVGDRDRAVLPVPGRAVVVDTCAEPLSCQEWIT